MRKEWIAKSGFQFLDETLAREYFRTSQFPFILNFRIVIIFCATITHELHHRLRADTWYIPPRQNNLGDFEIICNNLYFLWRVCKYNRLESDRFSSSWSVSLLKILINKAHMCDYDGVGAQKKYSRTSACSPIDVFMTFVRRLLREANVTRITRDQRLIGERFCNVRLRVLLITAISKICCW